MLCSSSHGSKRTVRSADVRSSRQIEAPLRRVNAGFDPARTAHFHPRILEPKSKPGDSISTFFVEPCDPFRKVISNGSALTWKSTFAVIGGASPVAPGCTSGLARQVSAIRYWPVRAPPIPENLYCTIEVRRRQFEVRAPFDLTAIPAITSFKGGCNA